MKILKGTLKGRMVLCPLNTRPVAVVVRKACFDILREEIEGKRVLDLFAGSGALGIEALSLGAVEAVFVDTRHSANETIKKNLAILSLSAKARVYTLDAFRITKEFKERSLIFDLVFLDPPYYKGILRKILQSEELCDIVTPFGYLVGFCYRKDEFLKESKHFSLITQKNYGQTLLLIYKKVSNA